ncbi:MAG: hypothetical protein ACRDZS_08380, partial [Acidimicrobiales bacterium]
MQTLAADACGCGPGSWMSSPVVVTVLVAVLLAGSVLAARWRARRRSRVGGGSGWAAHAGDGLEQQRGSSAEGVDED